MRRRQLLKTAEGQDDAPSMNPTRPAAGRARRAASAALFVILAVVVLSGCYYTPEQQQVLAQINSSRSAAGRPALPMNAAMAAKAQAWAERLAATGALAHTPFLQAESPSCAFWGAENIGGPAGDLVTMHRAFMGSSVHRANMLSSAANLAGTGVAQDRSGRLWVVHRFAGC